MTRMDAEGDAQYQSETPPTFLVALHEGETLTWNEAFAAWSVERRDTLPISVRSVRADETPMIATASAPLAVERCRI